MSTAHILLLGAIAGVTIFLGLPLGRMRNLSVSVRNGLAAMATGILLFLFWDVLSNGVGPVEARLEAHSWGWFALYAFLLAGGFAAGFMSLVHYDQWMQSHRPTRFVGPGAAAVDEFKARGWVASLSPGQRLAVLIATGIGLHNFGEGLAIGQSAASGAISLAVVLIVGFGLHNATEGFGIIGPISMESEPPTWGFLGLMGLIGGGPTFIGTVVGQAWVSPALATAFFAVAAGSILYVVIQLVDVCRKWRSPVLTGWMMLAGIALGFATDFVLVAAGV